MLIHPAADTTDIGRKLGLCSFLRGELGPHLTQCGLCRGRPPYQVASWSMQQFGAIDMGPIVRGCCAPFNWVTWVPFWHNVPGLRPASVPSGIFIHPTVWLQPTLAENWGFLLPLGELDPHLTQCDGHTVTWAETYLRAKCHLHPSNRLGTIHQRYRQTDRTDNGPIATRSVTIRCSTAVRPNNTSDAELSVESRTDRWTEF